MSHKGRQVCASCHSVNRIAFRSLIGVTHDEAGAKAIAESYEVTDGPNDIGEMFERPGKLSGDDFASLVSADSTAFR